MRLEVEALISKERIKLRRTLKFAGLMIVLLLGVAVIVSFLTTKHLRETIREQFNEEQLVLARVTAHRIETTVQAAVTDLILLNSLPAVQYADPESYESLLLSTLPVLHRDNILEIRRVDRFGETLFVASEQGVVMRQFGVLQSDAGAYLSWASDINNRGKTMGTGIRVRDPALDRRQLVMDLIIPTYETTANALHPKPSHGFAGYLKATVDVSRLLGQSVAPVKSGKSGYAWVIDTAGTFLYHPESMFLGENAFEVRSNRNPRISFARINDIQRNEMLQGKEGIGSYVSGWHREIVESMEKLIAYAPVRIQGPYMDYVWSVAVVAPAVEVEGIVGTVYGRYLFLQTLLFFAMIVSAGVAMLYQMRWASFLENQVMEGAAEVERVGEELAGAETHYRALVGNTDDLVFTVDGDGIIGAMNESMSRLFGVGSDELAGQSLYCLLPLDQTEEQLRMINQALRSGRSRTTETMFRIHDQDFWFNLRYVPVKGRGERGDVVLGLGRDITERKSVEKQLTNTEKLASLGTLAAGIAHEINNPLGIMMGFCELLLERIEPGTMEYNDLKTIERHGLHCKSIVERLLNFARISDESEDHCDINTSVEAILAVVKHTLNMNDIRLVYTPAEGLPLVGIDSRGLQQVILNLISNAVHALNGQGVLSIATRAGREPGWVEMVVADSGCGIKKEFLPRIFDPFFTTKKVGEGTGLGLSVSFGIISKSGGTITCESYTRDERPDGPGTTFVITLPAAKRVG